MSRHSLATYIACAVLLGLQTSGERTYGAEKPVLQCHFKLKVIGTAMTT